MSDVAEVFEQLVEQISIDSVLLNVTELSELASLHGRFENALEKLGTDTPETVSDAIKTALDVLEKLMLDEIEKPDEAVEEIVQTAIMLQKGVASGEWASVAATPSGDTGAKFLPEKFSLPAYIDESILADFLSRQPGVLLEVEGLILSVSNNGDQDALAELKRHLHTLKGETAILGLDFVEEVCHSLEDYLEEYAFDELTDAALEIKDWIEKVYLWCQEKTDSPESSESLIGRVLGHLEPVTPSGAEDFFDHPGEWEHEEEVAAEEVVENIDEEFVAGGEDCAEEVEEEIHEEDEAEDEEEIVAEEVEAEIESTVEEEVTEETETTVEEEVVDVLESAVEEEVVEELVGGEENEGWFGKSVVDMGDELGNDAELIGEFVQESLEHLENSDASLLILESCPDDTDAINTTFRAFHTIKGVAGFLKCEEIQNLAHHAENVLDKARKGEIKLAAGTMDAIFESVDMMRRLITYVTESLENGSPLQKEVNLTAMVDKLEALANGEPAPEGAVRKIKKPLGEALVDRGIVQTLDIEHALFKQVNEVPDRRLGVILVESCVISTAKLTQALAAKEANNDPRQLGEILVAMELVTVEELEHALQTQKEPAEKSRLGEILVRDGKVPAKEVAKIIRGQKEEKTESAKVEVSKAVHVKETVKVDSERLDRLVEMIGELVISESMVVQYPGFKEKSNTELNQYVGELDKITRELQEMGTSLRMVPIRPTFQKIARLIRDLSKKSNKEVIFEMVGEDTELDKSVVDRIGDPLVHMVRNAVDHGLEATAEDRIAAGKPAQGRVKLSAYHKGGSIYIDIEDDGRGLNREAILKKAIDKGIVTDPDALSDKEVWSLIFEAGFSTAEKITEISGRGVGMDVVRKNVEALRGLIDIQSNEGKGSIFSIRLPLTLAIIDGMVLRVGTQRFIVPTLSIFVSIRPTKDQISTVASMGKVMQHQGNLIPIYHVGHALGIADSIQDPTESIVLVVETEIGKVGLIVDQLLGQQQIVIKSLGDYLAGTPGFAGGAIMPDGKVGLIVDVNGLIKLAKETPIKSVNEISSEDDSDEGADSFDVAGSGFGEEDLIAVGEPSGDATDSDELVGEV